MRSLNFIEKRICLWEALKYFDGLSYVLISPEQWLGITTTIDYEGEDFFFLLA